MNSTNQASSNLDIGIQSGRPSSEIQLSAEAQLDVHQAYLVTMRQRFKTEINRLTRGDMSDLLTAQNFDAENLSFLMSYVYAWNWLQQNIHNLYQQEVLAAFANGPQAFLMDLILTSNTTNEFIGSYISNRY